MRSFNTGREWWCALSPPLKGEPLRFGVQSLPSKEFVTGMDILIGPLTFGKALPDILMRQFFCPIQNSHTVHLRTPLTTSSYAVFSSVTDSHFFYQEKYILLPQFLPHVSVEEMGQDWQGLMWKVDKVTKLRPVENNYVCHSCCLKYFCMYLMQFSSIGF